MIVEVKTEKGRVAFVNLATMAHYMEYDYSHIEEGVDIDELPIAVVSYPSPQGEGECCDFVIYNKDDHKAIINKLRQSAKGMY